MSTETLSDNGNSHLPNTWVLHGTPNIGRIWSVKSIHSPDGYRSTWLSAILRWFNTKIDQFGGSVDASIWSHIHMFEFVPKPQDLDISTDCIFTQILVIFLMTHPISHWYPKDLPGSSTHMCFCLNPPVLMVKSFLFTTNIYQVCHHTVNPPLMNKTHILTEVSKKSWGYLGYFLLIIHFHRIFHEINHPLMGNPIDAWPPFLNSSAAGCQAHAGCEVIKASAFFG